MVPAHSHLLGSSILDRLLSGVEVYPNLGPSDFREMAKFTEETNILGLPVHPIARPAEGIPALEFPGRLEEVPTPSVGAPLAGRLRSALASEPCLLVRGLLAGASARPFRLAVVLPQSSAHLAEGFERLMLPSGEASGPPDLALIVLPHHEEAVIGHFPDERLALVMGTDDLRAGLLVVVEAANRLWVARRLEHESRKARAESSPGAPETWEDIQILPGGCFPFVTGSPEAQPGLVFAGESIPDEWEKWLVAKLDGLAGCNSVECLLAGGEPWVIEGGGWISPFWRNPPVPAGMASRLPAWHAALAHPDALPFGVEVTDSGDLDFSAGSPDGFVIVPRSVVPRPHLPCVERVRPTRLFTHKHVKTDAMKLWSIGFPSPEII